MQRSADPSRSRNRTRAAAVQSPQHDAGPLGGLIVTFLALVLLLLI